MAIVLRQLYLLRSSAARVVPLFAWVAVDILLWGFISKYLNTVASTGLNFFSILLGAILLEDFFTRVMHGVTTAFLEDVWSRNFLNFFASPLTIGEYLGGLVITSIGTSAIGLGVMLALAGAAFGFSFAVYGVAFLPFLVVLFITGIAFGIFATAMVLRLGPASEWFVWPIPAMISPFVGVFYPVATLPAWMQYVSKMLPLSYVFEGMREVVSHGTFSAAMLFIGGCIAILYVVVACWTFSVVHKYAVRTGLIARYSAESVG
jgi:ABC-2 type transport system permease protein